MCFFYPPAYWYACLVLPHFLTSFIRQCTKRTFPNLLRTHKWFVGFFPLQMGILKGVCMVGALHFPTFFVRKSTKSAVSNLIYAMRTPKFVFFPHMGRLTEVCFARFPDFLGGQELHSKSFRTCLHHAHPPSVFFPTIGAHGLFYCNFTVFVRKFTKKHLPQTCTKHAHPHFFPTYRYVCLVWQHFLSISWGFPNLFTPCTPPNVFFPPFRGAKGLSCILSSGFINLYGFFFLKSFLFCCYFTAFQSTLTLTLWPKHLQYAPWHFWYCTPQPNLTTIRVITFAQFSRKKNSPKGTPAWRHNPVLFWEARWGRTPVNGAACPNLSRSQFCARSCSPRSWCQRKQK